MWFFIRVYLVIFLFSCDVQALTLRGHFKRVGAGSVAVEVENDGDKNSLVSASVVEIDSPLTDRYINMQGGELLFTPAKQVVRKNSKGKFKFSFKGERSDVERYFRATFQEVPVDALTRKEAESMKRMGVVQSSIALGYILIVTPNKPSSTYLISRRGVTNTGNITLMVRAVGVGARSNKDAAIVNPLLPGKHMSFLGFKSSEAISGTIEGIKDESFTLLPE